MPVHHFKIIEQTRGKDDVYDFDLPDHTAARREARWALSDLAYGMPTVGNEDDVTMEVTTAAGDLVYGARMAFEETL